MNLIPIVSSSNTPNPQTELINKYSSKDTILLRTITKHTTEYMPIDFPNIFDVLNSLKRINRFNGNIDYIKPTYEILEKERPVKPYLDVEFYCKLNTVKYPTIESINEKSEFLKTNLVADIQKYYHSNGYELKDADIKIVESLDELKKEKDLYKISKHVIINHYVDIDNIESIPSDIDDTIISRSFGKISTMVCYQNTKQAKALPDFIDGPCYYDEIMKQSCLDRKVYNLNQQFRLPLSIKSESDKRYLTNDEISYSQKKGTKREKNDKVLEYLVGVYGDIPTVFLDSHVIDTLTKTSKTSVKSIKPNNGTTKSNDKLVELFKTEIVKNFPHMKINKIITVEEGKSYRVSTTNNVCIDNITHNSDTREHYINYYESSSLYLMRCCKCKNSHIILNVDDKERLLIKAYEEDVNKIHLKKLYQLDQYNADDGYTDVEKIQVERLHILNDECIRNNRIRILKTPMNTGKSTFIGKEVEQIMMEKNDARILIIVPRISLAIDLKNKALRGSSFINYDDIPSSQRGTVLSTIPRLIIGVKSLKHLFVNGNLVSDYDGVYIDEIVECAKCITSDTAIMIQKIFKNTQSPLICDDSYNYQTHTFFKNIMKCNIIYNSFKPRELTIKIYRNPISWYAKVIRNLESGKRTAVLTTNQHISRTIDNPFFKTVKYSKNGDMISLPTLENIAMSMFDNKEETFVSITSHDEDRKDIISDLEWKLSQCKLLTYSSTIAVGIDINTVFSLPLFFYIESGSVDNNTILQYTGRIRSFINDKLKFTSNIELHILIGNSTSKYSELKVNLTDKFFKEELDKALPTLLSNEKKYLASLPDDVVEDKSIDKSLSRAIGYNDRFNSISKVIKRNCLFKSLYDMWIGSDVPYLDKKGNLLPYIEGETNSFEFYDSYSKNKKLHKQQLDDDIELIRKYSVMGSASLNKVAGVNNKILTDLMSSNTPSMELTIAYNKIINYFNIVDNVINGIEDKNGLTSMMRIVEKYKKLDNNHYDLNRMVYQEEGDITKFNNQVIIINDILSILKINYREIGSDSDKTIVKMNSETKKKIYNRRWYKQKHHLNNFDYNETSDKNKLTDNIDRVLRIIGLRFQYDKKLGNEEFYLSYLSNYSLEINDDVVLKTPFDFYKFKTDTDSGLSKIEDNTFTYKNLASYKFDKIRFSDTIKDGIKKLSGSPCLITLDDRPYMDVSVVNEEIMKFRCITQSKSKYDEITPKVQILLDNDEDGISKHEELDKLKKEVVHIETCQMISEMTSDILETCLLKINY